MFNLINFNNIHNNNNIPNNINVQNDEQHQKLIRQISWNVIQKDAEFFTDRYLNDEMVQKLSKVMGSILQSTVRSFLVVNKDANVTEESRKNLVLSSLKILQCELADHLNVKYYGGEVAQDDEEDHNAAMKEYNRSVA